jgi:ATP-dependent DNA ligase
MSSPAMLSHPIEEEADLDKLDAEAFSAEWKWDGIRVQLAGVEALHPRVAQDQQLAVEGAREGDRLGEVGKGAGDPFRPAMLSHPIEEEADLDKLDAEAFSAEWKWDGISNSPSRAPEKVIASARSGKAPEMSSPVRE